jgi:hypothetical protein
MSNDEEPEILTTSGRHLKEEDKRGRTRGKERERRFSRHNIDNRGIYMFLLFGYLYL